MAIHALSIGSGGDVFNVSTDSLAEEVAALLVCAEMVSHGIAESDDFVGYSSAGFRSSFLEASRGGGFVGWTVFAVVFVVAELDDHLDVGVGWALEFLHEAFAVALEGFDAQLVLAHEPDVVGLREGNVGVVLAGELELQWCWVGNVRSELRVLEVEFIIEHPVKNGIVEP